MCDSCDEKVAAWGGWLDVPAPTESGRGPWTDLSYVLGPGTPGGPPRPIRIERVHSLPKDLFNLTDIQMYAHNGTHVDAPLHYIADGPAVHEIPLDRLYGPAVVWRIDAPPLHFIQPAELERQRPRLKPGDTLVIDWGWADRIGTPDYARPPSLSVEAAEWLVRQGVKMLAVDTRSPDAPLAARWAGWRYPVHHVLLSKGVLIAECLRNLHGLAGRRVEAMFLGLNLQDSDGSPARVLARPLD